MSNINNNENQINRELCVDLLVRDNYNRDDAEAIVDKIIFFGKYFAGIDAFFKKVNNLQLYFYDKIIESKTLGVFFDEGSAFQKWSNAHKIACGITSTYGMVASLNDIDKSNSDGLPPDHDSLRGFLSSFLEIVNLLSGEATLVNAVTDSAIEFFNDALVMASNLANADSFGFINIYLSKEFREEYGDIEQGVWNIMSGNDISIGLSLEQLDVLTEYCNEKLSKDYPNISTDATLTYDEYMVIIEEYAENRFAYEIKVAFKDAGVTPEQLKNFINDFNKILSNAEFDRDWNIFWDMSKNPIYIGSAGLSQLFSDDISPETIIIFEDKVTGLKYAVSDRANNKMPYFRTYDQDNPYASDGKIYAIREDGTFVDVTKPFLEVSNNVNKTVANPEERDYYLNQALFEFLINEYYGANDKSANPLFAFNNVLNSLPNISTTDVGKLRQDTINKIHDYVTKNPYDNSPLKQYYNYLVNPASNMTNADWQKFLQLNQQFGKGTANKYSFDYSQISTNLYAKSVRADFSEYEMMCFVRISILRPDISDALMDMSSKGIDPLPGNFASQLLYSIQTDRLNAEFPDYFNEDGVFIDEQGFLVVTTESAAVGEGLESENETLPEEGNDPSGTGENEQGNETTPGDNNNGSSNPEDNRKFSSIDTDYLIGTALSSLSEVLSVAERDPLILDLDNDGFGILKKTEGTNFDLDKNGFAEKINWTSTDGFLCLDLNENGKIDNGGELFGDNTTMPDGSNATGGFNALTQYDTNNDGVIDQNDEVFAKLRVWVDADGNGESGEGELKSLEELGIVSISVKPQQVVENTGTEATIRNRAVFTKADGTTLDIAELWVSADMFDTVETIKVGETEDIDGKPNVGSIGNMNALQTAIALDETGELQELFDAFTAEQDIPARKALVEKMLYFMCGANEVDPTSRGIYMDAQTHLGGLQNVLLVETKDNGENVLFDDIAAAAGFAA
jgi:hypothetical protein